MNSQLAYTASRFGIRQSILNQLRCKSTIKYTYTDEAPALATAAFLPILNKFASYSGTKFETADISVAARVLALFPDVAPDAKDNLAALGELAKTPEANIIKLPNVSASLPQLTACIKELQSKGFKIPNYEQAKDKYAKVLGSAVNPVLREGNSDRRAAGPVKAFAQANPSKMIKPWKADCKTKVAHMQGNDFFGSEKSYTMPKAGSVKIEHVGTDGKVTVLKAETKLEAGEIIDTSFMSRKALADFVEETLTSCPKDCIISLHLKATMMKVSDPRMFGTVVQVYYKDLFAKHQATFDKLGVNPNNGFADVEGKIKTLPADKQMEINADIQAVYAKRPPLAYVNSAKGITNLHVPSDVIVDASMPNVIRDGGGMWNKADKLQDTICIIPDRCYATQYTAIIENVKKHGQFNVSTMGHTSNVGLMAKKAEEYGSHDKTFELPAPGTVRVVDNAGNTIFEHKVEKGDIWRMCQTKDIPIQDWVKLAVNRARASGDAAIFWLDPARAHDAQIKAKVDKYLKDHDTKDLDIRFMTPQAAMTESCDRARKGLNTISVTGNVLRDYNTDMFPILELGTSSRMLSIVPLIAGGGLYETGAGGSAPKHVQQFLEEGHLRWDSLGEYLATAVSLEELGQRENNPKTTELGKGLNIAITKWLNNNRGPSRKVKEIDNRGSHFYIALYWAEALKDKDPTFKTLYEGLASKEAAITKELIDCQGKQQDIGGYYQPNAAKVAAAMRPSKQFNDLIDK